MKRTAEDRPSFLTVHDFAALFHIAEVTVRKWIAQRTITVVKLGRSIRIPLAEVERLVEQGMVPARDPPTPQT
jgi:excisionase family DNA binding protein